MEDRINFFRNINIDRDKINTNFDRISAVYDLCSCMNINSSDIDNFKINNNDIDFDVFDTCDVRYVDYITLRGYQKSYKISKQDRLNVVNIIVSG